ncbi:uncharacterized protein LOC112549992 [Alligator sinensis]|uniref:Uncharacterized protein LOC112549992 n=1 Tax=Alligator sinensis TaxID=38654 RepID=A0A3Q0GE18_ALLSI|nr:uncharacterized protein LOC112549992 [Alligator sinensis]
MAGTFGEPCPTNRGTGENRYRGETERESLAEELRGDGVEEPEASFDGDGEGVGDGVEDPEDSLDGEGDGDGVEEPEASFDGEGKGDGDGMEEPEASFRGDGEGDSDGVKEPETNMQAASFMARLGSQVEMFHKNGNHLRPSHGKDGQGSGVFLDLPMARGGLPSSSQVAAPTLSDLHLNGKCGERARRHPLEVGGPRHLCGQGKPQPEPTLVGKCSSGRGRFQMMQLIETKLFVCL